MLHNIKILLLLTIICSWLIGNTNLFATKYFVSNVTQFNSAVAVIQPGDTVEMQNGIWNNCQLVFRGNGTQQNPIVLMAETPGRVIISGASNLRIGGTYLIAEGMYFKDGYSPSGGVVEFRYSGIESQYCRLTDCAIVNFNPASNITDYKWISLYGKYNRVDHCYIKDKKHQGTTLVVWLSSQPNYHLIDHNYFADRPPLGVNGGETIRVGTSDWSLYDSYTTVEYNYFENCDGEIEIISNKSCENIYRYNTFFNNNGALTLRHGNRCTVEGNYFFGNGKSGSGGIRIIGEDHKIINNYIVGTRGSGYRSALSMVNGIPDSPLNGYYQVKRAVVAFNTFVDNTSNFTIGVNDGSTQSLPPLDCTIANNLVKGSVAPLIKYDSSPINMYYEGNIMFGASLGITQPEGIKIMDPLLESDSTGLWRPSLMSPAIDSASGNYPYITMDMDAQARTGLFDIGADENSNEPINNPPLGPEDIGPSWLNLILTDGIISVQAGMDSLRNAVINAPPFSIIELVTDGGLYINSDKISISVPITIRAKTGLINKPTVKNLSVSSSEKTTFEMKSGGNLLLSGVILEGNQNSSSPNKYLVRTDTNSFSDSYRLTILNSDFLDVISNGNEGNFFKAFKGTKADSVIIKNCTFNNCGGDGINFSAEDVNSGLFNVSYFEVNNSTFWKIPGNAIKIYGGDSNPSTVGPKVKINHITFDNCGFNNSSIVSAVDVDNTEIVSSLLTNSPGNVSSIILSGSGSLIRYSDLFNVGPVSLDNGAIVGSGMLYVDPLYLNATSGDFTLANNSPVIGMAFDFTTLGDLRWLPATPVEEINILPEYFTLEQNYPNPFNPSTIVEFSIPHSSHTTLKIFDVAGSLVEELIDEYLGAGSYKIDLKLYNCSGGVYFYQLTSSGKVITKKMTYLK